MNDVVKVSVEVLYLSINFLVTYGSWWGSYGPGWPAVNMDMITDGGFGDQGYASTYGWFELTHFPWEIKPQF